jgi:hypothetical protein
MLPVIQVITMIPGIGVLIGTCLRFILVLAGVGEACIGDILIIPITLIMITGMDIIRGIGMAIMAMVIMIIIRDIIMATEKIEVAQTIQVPE